MQDHLVPDGDVAHRCAHRVHPAGVLVADRVRQGDAGFLFPLAFQDVQVGAADAGTADAHDDVQRSIDGGFGDLGELELGVISDHLDGSHWGFLVLVLLMWGVTAPPSS